MDSVSGIRLLGWRVARDPGHYKMSVQHQKIDPALELFLTLAREDPALQKEFEESLGTFFESPISLSDPQAVLQGGWRHSEWFICERHSPTLRGTPVEQLAKRWLERAPAEFEETLAPLQSSFTGVFAVGEVREGEGLWVQDLAGLGEHPVLDQEASTTLKSGDLIVGRLYPLDGSMHHLSRAIACLRSSSVEKAMRRDLDAMRKGGRGNVLHLSQKELEKMFWGSGDKAGEAQSLSKDHVQSARTMLLNSGVGASHVDEVLSTLNEAPFDASSLVHGAGDVLATILDELAFDTPIDLTEARRALTLAWAQLAKPLAKRSNKGASASNAEPASEDDDTVSAVTAFGEGLKNGHDLKVLFDRLEEELAIEVDEDVDGGEDSKSPDFPGVVGAMVQEFIWEVSLEQGDKASTRLVVLDKLSRFAADIGTFEDLSTQDLLRFATFWVLERDELKTEQEARDLIPALRAFCSWADREHELKLLSDMGKIFDALEDSLPRIVLANRARVSTATSDAQNEERPGELLKFIERRDTGEIGLEDRAGNALTAVIDDALVEHLECGDRMRAHIEADRRAKVYCCYPSEVAELER